MEPLVTIRQLEPEQVMLAFPLVREAVGGVTPDDWQDTASKLTGGGAETEAPGGIVVAERNGFPRALFTYEITDLLAPERQLLVRNLVVMEFVKRAEAARVLFDHMDVLANKYSCARVHVDLPKVSAWVRKNWEELARDELDIPFTCSD